MNIAEQLTDIYLTEETWHVSKLSKEESDLYHDTLLSKGNIIVIRDGEQVVGYCEFWRLTYEQFGRIICGEPFSAMHEDVQTGQIAYVANTFIKKEYRKGEVTKMLRNRFFEANTLCTHFCGQARRKKSEPVKVFKRNVVPERI